MEQLVACPTLAVLPDACPAAGDAGAHSYDDLILSSADHLALPALEEYEGLKQSEGLTRLEEFVPPPPRSRSFAPSRAAAVAKLRGGSSSGLRSPARNFLIDLMTSAAAFMSARSLADDVLAEDSCDQSTPPSAPRRSRREMSRAGPTLVDLAIQAEALDDSSDVEIDILGATDWQSPANRGIDAQRIAQLPRFTVAEPKPPAPPPAAAAGMQCSVCLDDMQVGEIALRLPCAHSYHENCISPWLGTDARCPMCRSAV